MVARSSAKAEFKIVAHGIYEGMWIKRLLEELTVFDSTHMKVYCDNKATISIAHNPILHKKKEKKHTHTHTH